MIDNFCECNTVGEVARDGKSTCMQCGGVDAYKASPLRAKQMIWRNALLDPPPSGTPVIVYGNGVVQNETYIRIVNGSDNLWYRDGMDMDVAWDIEQDHYWMPLPGKPELGEKK